MLRLAKGDSEEVAVALPRRLRRRGDLVTGAMSFRPSSWGMLRVFRALREAAAARGEARVLRMLLRVLGFSLAEGLGVADLGSAPSSSGSGLKRSLRDCSSLLAACDDRERLRVEGCFSMTTFGTREDLVGFVSEAGSSVLEVCDDRERLRVERGVGLRSIHVRLAFYIFTDLLVGKEGDGGWGISKVVKIVISVQSSNSFLSNNEV